MVLLHGKYWHQLAYRVTAAVFHIAVLENAAYGSLVINNDYRQNDIDTGWRPSLLKTRLSAVHEDRVRRARWRKSLYSGDCDICMGRLLRVDLIKWVSKCPSARPYVRTSVRPSTKSFFRLNKIWYVCRGRRVMHDDMQYDPIQG